MPAEGTLPASKGGSLIADAVQEEHSGRLSRRGPLKYLVTPESAVTGAMWQARGKLAGDHSTMIKFREGDGENYPRATHAIRSVLSGAAETVHSRYAIQLGLDREKASSITKISTLPAHLGRGFLGRDS